MNFSQSDKTTLVLLLDFAHRLFSPSCSSGKGLVAERQAPAHQCSHFHPKNTMTEADSKLYSYYPTLQKEKVRCPVLNWRLKKRCNFRIIHAGNNINCKLYPIFCQVIWKYSQVPSSYKVGLAVSQHGATFLINELCLAAVFGLQGQKWVQIVGQVPLARAPNPCSVHLGLVSRRL